MHNYKPGDLVQQTTQRSGRVVATYPYNDIIDVEWRALGDTTPIHASHLQRVFTGDDAFITLGFTKHVTDKGDVRFTKKTKQILFLTNEHRCILNITELDPDLLKAISLYYQELQWKGTL